MGAWSEDAFGNDAACDWAYDLEDATDLSLIKETLETAIEDDEYVDSDDASQALAACEVIARLKGNWGIRNSYTETIDQWVEAHPIQPPAELIALAVKVIERIIQGPDSELRELWQETGDGAWLVAVEELRRRVIA